MSRSRAPSGGLPGPWLAVVVVLHILPFASRPALIGGDEPHYALMAHSLAADGDVALEDDYDEVARGAPWAGRKRAGQDLDRHLRSVNGAASFAHPLGLPALAAPLLALQQAVSPGAAPDLVLGLLALAVTLAALIAGIRLLGSWAGDARLGAVAALAAYFSSPLWFYSRTFTTEPFIWSWAVLALASLRAGRPALASLFLGLCLAMKETAVLIVAPILIAALAALGVRRAWVLWVGPAAFAVLFAVKNLVLGAPLLATFQPYRLAPSGEGLVGFLVDSRRGLLWFAPLLLLAAFGWPWAVRSRPDRLPLLTGVVILVAYYLLSALWVDWRGGSSYGPRLLVPVLPVLALPLAELLRAGPGRLLRVILLAGFAAGLAVNLCAALKPFRAFWSASVWELLAGSPAAAATGAILALGAALAARRTAGGVPSSEKPGSAPA